MSDEQTLHAEPRKRLRNSKTFWFNLLASVAAVGTYFLDSGMMTPQTTAIAGSIIGAINVFLRSITKDAIEGV